MTPLLLAALLAQGAPMVADPPARAAPALAPAAAPSAPPAPAPAPAAARGAHAADAGAPEPALPEAKPIDLATALDRKPVTLGEPFSLRIAVTHDPGDAFALPDGLAPLLAKGSLVLREEPSVAREALSPQVARTTFAIPLVALTSLKPELPDLRLLAQGPAGPRQLTVPGQKIEVESLVAREGAPNPEHAHHGPKPPEPVWIRSWLWAGLLAALALAVAGVIALRRLRKLQAQRAEEPPPPPLPHDEAFRRLQELRKRAPWSHGEGRAAIFEFSEIVRAYLGKRLGFHAVDLTSEELVRELRHRELEGLDRVAFAEQLEWEDLVKFARMEPTAAECLGAVDGAQELVEKTAARMAKVRHADLAQPPAGPARPAAPESGGRP